jgi:carbon storage regulator
MLVLSRKVGERIVVGGNITITVVRMGQGNVRIGIEAPNDMPIVRDELLHGTAEPRSPRREITVEPIGELCDVTLAH